jgi:hypothetical protein
MRRFRLPVLMLTLALLLSACRGGAIKQSKWGPLEIGMENIQQDEKQWSANLVVKNPTGQMQVMHYVGPARYVLEITRGGNEVLVQGFDAKDPEKAETLNLAGGVTKNHIVVWTFRDKDGNRVEPGTYQARVHLNALTPVKTKAGQATQAVQAPVLGPFQITVK